MQTTGLSELVYTDQAQSALLRLSVQEPSEPSAYPVEGENRERQIDVSGKPRFRYDHRTHRMVPIQELPPGKAHGCNEFSNRGLGPEYNEVTVWPKTVHYHLTTGEGHSCTITPSPIELNSTEKQICKLLGLREWELGTFLKSWEPSEYGHGSGSQRYTGKRPETIEEIRRALTATDPVMRGKDVADEMRILRPWCWRIRTASKTHTCAFCKSEITEGQQYRDGGGNNLFRAHLECAETEKDKL